MSDRLGELQSTVAALAEEVRRLDARVRELEGRPAPAAARAAAGEAEPEPVPPAVAMPQGTVALLGRTLLVLAGAYLVRALTEGRALPAAVGVGLGLAYAAFWQLRADREAGAGRRESAVFHALAGSLIAFPLVWETAARFSLLGPRPAGAALVGFFAIGLAVAWRQRLGLVAWATTGLALATALALLLATKDLLAAFVALLAVAAALEWLAYRERWLALRWGAALVLDAVAFLLVALATRPQGLPPAYVPFRAAAAALALLALPALYVAGLAARTLKLGRPVTLFEVAQGSLAVLLGFGGAWRALSAHAGSTTGLGVLALLLGALCYGAAFAFAERRPGQGRNFYFYSTAGGVLVLAGATAVAFGPALPFVLGGLGLLAGLFGRRFERMTLRVHSALYLVAGALESGLFVACARAVAGQTADALPPLAWAAAVAAALGWLVLASDPGAPRTGGARLPQALLAVLVVFAVGKALQAGLWAAVGERAGTDAGLAAVLRTAILAALVVGLALAARRWAWPELGWLVYPLVALGGVKLLLQDLRHGRPATLVLSLALYGAVLVLAPRLLKPAGSAPGRDRPLPR
jgi:hypothetical protein